MPELDDECIAHMEEVLELYEQGYNPEEPVVCLDERPTPLHGETREASPAKPARYDYEYVRKGTANIFCAVEPLAGRHIRFYGEVGGRQIWERYTVHFTPKHGSWLNMAEIEIGLLNRQVLGKRRFSDLRSLRKQVGSWNQRVNKLRQKITWTSTRKKARKTFSYKPTKPKRSQH